MKKKITGIISFIAGIGCIVGGIGIITTENIDDEEFIAISALLLSGISTVLYIIWTNFGGKMSTELDKVRSENELLKLQIEQNELKSKLNEQNKL